MSAAVTQPQAPETHKEADLKYEKWPTELDPSFLSLDSEELTFFSDWTGIKDEEELKKHIISVQAKAYAVRNQQRFIIGDMMSNTLISYCTTYRCIRIHAYGLSDLRRKSPFAIYPYYPYPNNNLNSLLLIVAL